MTKSAIVTGNAVKLYIMRRVPRPLPPAADIGENIAAMKLWKRPAP